MADAPSVSASSGPREQTAQVPQQFKSFQQPRESYLEANPAAAPISKARELGEKKILASPYSIGGEKKQQQLQSQLKESNLKVLQLEHDLKLKEMKLQIQDLQSNSSLDQLKNQIMQLEISVSKLAKEKIEVITQKDSQIKKGRAELKQLEQELVDSKIASAYLKSQCQTLQNRVAKLKKQARAKDEEKYQSKFLEGFDNKKAAKAESENKRYVDQLKQGQASGEEAKQQSDQAMAVDNEDWNYESKAQTLEVVPSVTSFDDETNTVLVLGRRISIKNSATDPEVIRKWVTLYVPMLETQIQAATQMNIQSVYGMLGSESFKNISSSQQKQLEQAFHAGVPAELRKHVWQLVMPNHLRVTPKMYEVFLERTRLSAENLAQDPSFRKSLKVIEEDLHRTYPDMSLFRAGNKYYEPLKNVLMAYSMFRPDLGYVQGMSYVAASLLLHFDAEYETFMLFANLMAREDMLFDFYSFDMDRVGVVFQVFMKLLREKVPGLHATFERTNLSCSIFLFEWVVAIYSNIFPLETSSRVWDNFMYYGEFYIIKVALALCSCIEAKAGQGDSSFENIVLLLKNVKQEVSSEQMFKAIQDLKLTKVQFIKVKKQVLNSVAQK